MWESRVLGAISKRRGGCDVHGRGISTATSHPSAAVPAGVKRRVLIDAPVRVAEALNRPVRFGNSPRTASLMNTASSSDLPGRRTPRT